MKKLNERRIVWIDRKIYIVLFRNFSSMNLKKKFRKQSRTFELDQKFCVVGTELDSIYVT